MIEIDVGAARARLSAELLDCTVDPRWEYVRFMAEARERFDRFPPSVKEAVAAFAADEDADGVLVLRGLPVDPLLPLTPSHSGDDAHKRTRVSELCLCGVGCALGHPVGYRNERQGAVIHDVYPTQTNERQLSSDSSRSTLGFHTEMAFHSLLPDYVVLVGLRQDPERRARTSFAGVRRILARVDDRTRELLWSHPVEVQIEYSYARVNGAPARPQKRVLYGDASDPYLRFDTDLMRSELPEVQAALVAVTERLSAVEGGVELEPGMLVAFDNRRCVHGRSSFKAHYDGRDRWLQRTVVRRELPCGDFAEPARPWLITRFM
jgi:alpha-ketoglutarate-dependent taurine dioxygenase